MAGLLTSLLGLAGPVAGDDPSRQKPVDFAHDIAPLIKARCAECHTDGKYKGSFSLDTREAMLKSEVVVPGKSGESELIERVTSNDPEIACRPRATRLTGRRGRAGSGPGSTRGCPGSKASRSSGRPTSPR